MTTTMSMICSSPSTRPILPAHTNSLTLTPSSSLPLRCIPTTPTRPNPKLVIGCQVALKPDSSIEESDPELKSSLEKVGQKVKVKSPIKVYHIPKVPEFELTPDMVGVIKQYVGYWKGKRISPNFPFKVEFVVEIEGRGPVKFVAHLKDDEFDIVD